MNNNLKPITTLPPFKRFCMTIGELPTSYIETMSYYEMLLWFTKYLSETVIPAINNNAEAVSELQSKYIELKNYVDTYFENLDLQEEINNKLDSMVLDGSLGELISNYLPQDVVFNRIFRIVDTYELQGCCQYNNYIIAGGYSGTSSKVYVLSKTGDILNEYAINDNSHVNSIAYHETEQKFYIVNTTGSVEIYDTSFNYQETLSVTNLYAVCYYNGVMYGITTTKKLYNFSTSASMDLNFDSNNTVPQNFIIKDNKIFVLYSNNNTIFMLDMEGTLIKTFNISRGNVLFPYGECENLFILDDKIHVNSMCYFGQSLRNNFINQFWETNIYNNIAIGGNVQEEINYNLYVNNTANNNPTGTQNSPFNYLSELSIVANYRKIISPTTVINNYIGDSTLAGMYNGTLSNNSGKTITLNLYNSNITLRNNDNANSVFAGNVYYSNVRCGSYCNLSATVENSNLLISDAATFTGTCNYCDVNITNRKNHAFTPKNCTFNPATIIDPTTSNSLMESILKMNYSRPYTIIFELSGDAYDSLAVQINDTRHASINSNNGLTIPTSRGNITIKKDLITQDANVHCYGVTILR